MSHVISSNRIIVFNCTEAWAPIRIYLHVSGQNESVQLKPIDTLYDIIYDIFSYPATVRLSLDSTTVVCHGSIGALHYIALYDIWMMLD